MIVDLRDGINSGHALRYQDLNLPQLRKTSPGLDKLFVTYGLPFPKRRIEPVHRKGLRTHEC